MSDRGEYRAIRRVLLDGPDFQQLPERARFVFVALKINLGPAGIEVWYPAELSARLSAQIGASSADVETALAMLEQSGWIAREANVIWIVGQLVNDPHVKQSDAKHRKMIQRHLEGLPRLGIVAQFAKAHRSWISSDGTPSGAPCEGLAWAIKGPPKGHRSTEKEKEKEKENETEKRVSPIGGASWVADGVKLWEGIMGSVGAGEFGKQLKPMIDLHGWPAVRPDLEKWLRERAKVGKPARPSWYAGEVTARLAPKPKIRDDDGTLTEYGERLTRPDKVPA